MGIAWSQDWAAVQAHKIRNHSFLIILISFYGCVNYSLIWAAVQSHKICNHSFVIILILFYVLCQLLSNLGNESKKNLRTIHNLSNRNSAHQFNFILNAFNIQQEAKIKTAPVSKLLLNKMRFKHQD